MANGRTIVVEDLAAADLGACGRVLGGAFPTDSAVPAYHGPLADFWHVHDFDPGDGGEPEVLWVRYRNAELRVGSLEAHWCTEQAVVPLDGVVVHVLCPTRDDGSRQPDLAQLRAFRLTPGRGICMARGAWHASFVLEGETTCLMLTRASTTRELARHLAGDGPATETSIVTLVDTGAAAPRLVLP